MTIKSVEENLQKLINKYHLSEKITVEMIKEWIYNEEGKGSKPFNDFTKKCLNYFSVVSDIDELNEILQFFIEAWNSFPHKSLGGKSPYQMMMENRKYNN
ncbi:MAG: hypothetical protein DDT21_02656 [Syntrophomonadaceae bacterium]|nr:hypothetical protein [Bacillota bacterium]